MNIRSFLLQIQSQTGSLLRKQLTESWHQTERELRAFNHSVFSRNSQKKSNLPLFLMNNRSFLLETQSQTGSLLRKQLTESWHQTERELRTFSHSVFSIKSQKKSNLPPFLMNIRSFLLEIQSQTGSLLRKQLTESWHQAGRELRTFNHPVFSIKSLRKSNLPQFLMNIRSFLLEIQSHTGFLLRKQLIESWH